jgi:hypothetical protein
MVTVQLRDAANPDKVLFGPAKLPFEPRENKPFYVRRTFNDQRHVRCFVITDVYAYEVIENEPERSGIVYLARETKP